jgi:hypothetical protein
MGNLVLTRGDMCIVQHYYMLRDLLLKGLDGTHDAVLEIGAGIGDVIAELAAREINPGVDYFAGEIARYGRRSAERFAAMLKIPNLHAVDFDITAPDFSFLKGKRRVFVFSHFSLVYVNPFPPSFLRALLDCAEHVECMLFEPFSFCLKPSLTQQPLYSRNQARASGIAENLWPALEELAQEGCIEMREVIPDICGKTILTSVSLAHFIKT